MTPLAPVLQDMRDFARKQKATLWTAIMQSCIGMVITKTMPSGPLPGPAGFGLAAAQGDSGTTPSGMRKMRPGSTPCSISERSAKADCATWKSARLSSSRSSAEGWLGPGQGTPRRRYSAETKGMVEGGNGLLRGVHGDGGHGGQPVGQRCVRLGVVARLEAEQPALVEAPPAGVEPPQLLAAAALAQRVRESQIRHGDGAIQMLMQDRPVLFADVI